MSPSQRRACEYLNVNAPQGMDVPQGFSYLREIQPIWNAHCVGCHTGRKKADGSEAPLSLLADTKNYGWKEAWEGVVCRQKTAEYVYPQTGKDMNPGRDYCESYVNLTKYGRVCYEQVNDLVNWLPMATSEPPMIPPYSFGSSKSRLMHYLEPGHYGVTLTQRDKDRVACWIDLNVPYCGSYMEANKWDAIVHTYIHSYRNQCRAAYLFQEAKRLRHAEIELAHLDFYRQHLRHGANAGIRNVSPLRLGWPGRAAAVHRRLQPVAEHGSHLRAGGRQGRTRRIKRKGQRRPQSGCSTPTPRHSSCGPTRMSPPIATSGTCRNARHGTWSMAIGLWPDHHRRLRAGGRTDARICG